MRLGQWFPSRPDLPGMALAGGVGAVSVALARALPPSPYVSDVLIAMLLGALVLNTPLRRSVGLELPSMEREPDRYAHGLRYVGKWLLRLGIVLMGLKVQTSFFGRGEVFVVACACVAALPSAFFAAHALGGALGLRRPLTDLLAAGTMICGASAVNAAAPVAGAHRQEQGLAIGVVYLFSVFAMLTFRPIAQLMGMDPAQAGLWSGLAVNDLSSAVAVGAQMGGAGGVMAAASKSARILLLAPLLVTLSLLRRTPGAGASSSLTKSIVEALPAFLLGYVALALLRATGDRVLGDVASWRYVLEANELVLDLLMATVSAGIGLHLSLRAIVATSGRAVIAAGGTSLLMAGLALAMIATSERAVVSVAIGAGALCVTGIFYRMTTTRAAELGRLARRFDAGEPVALAEATALLDAAEARAALDDAFARRVITQLSPSIGELIPVRRTPLAHGVGCRWMTYWEGRTGWALVAILRDPGNATPIHAHPHRLIGKAIEGTLEELRFREHPAPAPVQSAGASTVEVELVSRAVLGHNELVETDGLATLHVVRAVGDVPSIDLQLRGPEVGEPGRRVLVDASVDFGSLEVGARLRGTMEIDDRPGQGGEGAAAGRWKADVDRP